MQEVVLLVDDDRYILHGLARALRHQPYQLYTATSGTEAQWILKSRNVDVIVADQQMPGMSGTDLLTWIAENYPEVTRIMLTGCPDLRTAMRAINQGAVFHFLTKPCNPALLAVTIRKALERKALLLENRRLLDVNGRQMQRLESYRRDLDALTTLVVRDIQTPLQTMLGSCRLLEERYHDVFDPKTRTLIDSALDSIGLIRSLLDSLLEHCQAQGPADGTAQSKPGGDTTAPVTKASSPSLPIAPDASGSGDGRDWQASLA